MRDNVTSPVDRVSSPASTCRPEERSASRTRHPTGAYRTPAHDTAVRPKGAPTESVRRLFDSFIDVVEVDAELRAAAREPRTPRLRAHQALEAASDALGGCRAVEAANEADKLACGVSSTTDQASSRIPALAGSGARGASLNGAAPDPAFPSLGAKSRATGRSVYPMPAGSGNLRSPIFCSAQLPGTCPRSVR